MSLSTLPLEIRQEIWILSLEPRVVEVKYAYAGWGFIHHTNFPTAFRICHESRATVEHLYPLCFGSFLYPPKVPFNLSLDTVYLDKSNGEQFQHFFGILREHEALNLRYLAIDARILGTHPVFESREDQNQCAVDILACLFESNLLPGIVELTLVYDLAYWTKSDSLMAEDDEDQEIVLYEALPQELRVEAFKARPLPNDTVIRRLLSQCPGQQVTYREVYGWRKHLSGRIFV